MGLTALVGAAGGQGFEQSCRPTFDTAGAIWGFVTRRFSTLA
ncbi:MAG TPA: hypothetical protein VHF27_04180 [Acidimicrobiales bacterium]|nr:hypothetical protein [Acidimicrobiales bacterium]